CARDWSADVCSSDLSGQEPVPGKTGEQFDDDGAVEIAADFPACLRALDDLLGEFAPPALIGEQGLRCIVIALRFGNDRAEHGAAEPVLPEADELTVEERLEVAFQRSGVGEGPGVLEALIDIEQQDRKSTRLNSSH